MHKNFSAAPLFIILLLCACAGNKSQNSADSLITAIRNSENCNQLMLCGRHIKMGIKAGKYNYTHVDMKYVRDHAGNAILNIPTQQLYDVYAKAGMTNAKDYVDTEIKMATAMGKLMVEFPELQPGHGKNGFSIIQSAVQAAIKKNQDFAK